MHFFPNASVEHIAQKATSFSTEIVDWSTKYDNGELSGSETGIKHIVLQACYGDKVAYEVAKKNPGIYVSGATGKLGAANTSTGYKNIFNIKTEKKQGLFFGERTVETEGLWNTYYCIPGTEKVIIVNQWPHPEPPVLKPKNE